MKFEVLQSPLAGKSVILRPWKGKIYWVLSGHKCLVVWICLLIRTCWESEVSPQRRTQKIKIIGVIIRQSSLVFFTLKVLTNEKRGGLKEASFDRSRFKLLTLKFSNKFVQTTFASVQHTLPGCLSRIRLFSIPNPGSDFFSSRIHIKEFKYFNPKIDL